MTNFLMFKDKARFGEGNVVNRPACLGCEVGCADDCGRACVGICDGLCHDDCHQSCHSTLGTIFNY